MKQVVVFVALVAFAQAGLVWPKIEPRNGVAPIKGFPPLHGSRIINGEEAGKNQFPHMAALFIDGKFCGGSLISKRYILTAAHCTEGAKSVNVGLGVHKYNQAEPSQVWITSTKFIIHEGYRREGLLNDISLIELPTPAPLSNAIQTIRLPRRSEQNDDFNNEWAIISGWGLSAPGGSKTDRLMYIMDRILTNKACSDKFGSMIKDTNICAGGDGIHSVCKGDSGGPLIIHRNREAIQVGLTSFVAGGCDLHFPNVYTRVSQYLDWIQRNSDVVIS